MADQSALFRAFADYARTTLGDYEVGEVLHRLTDQVVEVLGVAGAGVSVGQADGRLTFVTATDEPTSRIEHQQAELAQGPCHDAFRSGEPVTAADLRTEERWPGYTDAAMELGLHAVAGIPMIVRSERIGALNVYSRDPREWPADDVETAQLLADMASGYIVSTRTLEQHQRLAGQLQHALDSRVVVEQAKGMLAAQHGIDPSAAWERLRSYARNHQAKVHDLAQAVLDGRLTL
jgi:GAF domain-containing protein